MSKETDIVDWRRHYERHTGTWLQELEPDWSITMVEQMSSVAEGKLKRVEQCGYRPRGADGLNYTPQTAGINIDKAVDINEAFHISRQFWAHQVTRGVLNKPNLSLTACRT